MSTKSSVLLTDDHNEHWFTDCTPEKHGDDVLYDVLTIDIATKNILRFEQREECIIIDIDPRSDLHKIITQSNLSRVKLQRS